MSDNVIEVKNISKRYRLGVQQKADTFAGQLKNMLMYPINNLRQIRRMKHFDDADDPTVFWALRDINFEVKQGEVLGIIGHNGAGKSTLLKILSRITEPTSGEVKIKGRMSSLLEVGTGFHPELTGRENVYMNGTILGMTKKEIDQKFDEIVAFAGVERHIDTPVKFYSSGMQVRLGFSVAAHLEPEILVIDEVLAVGDAEFQRKCLGKMDDVAKSGRTVLFVSHNMGSVQNLCTQGLLLKNGKLELFGSIQKVIDSYITHVSQKSKNQIRLRSDRQGDGKIRIAQININDRKGKKVETLISGEDYFLKIGVDCNKEIYSNIRLSIGIDDMKKNRITHIDNTVLGKRIIFSDRNFVLIHLKRLSLAPGKYFGTIFLEVDNIISDWILDAFEFVVEKGDYYKTGYMPPDGRYSFLMEYDFM